MDENTLRAFVIGWPISHSLSPHLHQFWLRQYGINGNYEKIAVPPGELSRFLDDMEKNNFVGGNVTIPHKENVFSSLKYSDEISIRLQATNTLSLESGMLLGANTDGYGFSANLDQHSKNWRKAKTAMVLGAGGAAKAIVLALIDAGFSKIYIANRTVQRAKNLADLMGAECESLPFKEAEKLLSDIQLLVNTTSLGMKGQSPLEIDISQLPKSAIVTDIVYNPLETTLLKNAKRLQLEVVDGIGMLLHQAVPGFEKWFGIRPKVTSELRTHMLNILRAG